ncbi:hypothetical protein VD0002_g2037 [Verticillium dahliae]|uniref:Major facilitator superfamily (MFS) profile domain-containing protein n=1 Tax=Verticillium dahliae TaxID=27337 RepID=A0AA44WNK1_VERDA|nr:hypothetical protein BJF96_g2079 [Verticillium dahliae]PNH53810.1 hypothetical protein VD0003_g3661 [Verticillium dahliae]PNH67823.1 hypothetical protein VD0002_g2037 [Verticillium dahliae]
MLTFLREHNYNVSKHISSNLLMAIMVLCTSVLTFGFETSILSSIQAMDSFERRFGDINPVTGKYSMSANKLAYLNSFPLISYAIGVIVAAQISERRGRHVILLIMNTICIGGVCLSLFAKNYGQSLGGRMLIQTHVGMEAYLVPMFVAELAPAAIRGSMVATYALSHIFAAFLGAIVTNFTSRIDGDASWRIPVGLIMIFPVLALAFSFLVPESPRWLLRKGRFDEAADSIYYLRGAVKEYPAEAEAQLILETIENAAAQGRWRDLFRGTNTRRTWVGILAAASTQLTGQTFASNYGTVFLKSLNIMDPFTATLIKRSIILVGCVFVILFVERLGRRRLSLIVGSLCGTSLLVMGGLGTVASRSTVENNTLLTMTILFPVFYMVGFGSTMQVVKSELPHTSLRDKSIMIQLNVANACNFLTTFTLPYLLEAPYANLGPKVGFVYGSICVVIVFLLFFFIPEMTKRSLEEIDEMMDAKVPARRTRSWKSSGLGSKLTELGNGNIRL